MDKETRLKVFFTTPYKSLDLVVSFNGTKEAISYYTFVINASYENFQLSCIGKIDTFVYRQP